MTVVSETRDRIDSRLENGLLGRWYALAKTVQVQPERPLAVKALGRNLVLWRDPAGKVHCLEDYCPHRGAPLSRGEVLPEGLSCRYHGVTLDGTGTIVRVPAMPSCTLEGRKAIAAFTTAECNDVVLAYFPSREAPEAPPYQPPAEFTDLEWSSFLCMARWRCNYRYALDNLADPMHGSYLHAQSFTLAYGEKQDTMRLIRSETGFRVERVGQQDVNFDWTEMVIENNQMYCRLDIPYPASAGPGGPFRIIGYVTPVDTESCLVFFWRCRKVSGLARDSWRFLYRTTWERRHWHVLEQDREMLESMPPTANRREMLYQHDIGVSRLRQIMFRAAKSQLAAEDAAQQTASEMTQTVAAGND